MLNLNMYNNTSKNMNLDTNQLNKTDNVIQFPFNRVNTELKEQKNQIEQNIDTILNSAIDSDIDTPEYDKGQKKSYAAKPVKDLDTVKEMLNYWYNKHTKIYNKSVKQPSTKFNPRYLRNYLLLLIGFNCGLRVSDLVKLQIGHFIDKGGEYRDKVEILEKKTINTRQKKDTRTIYINNAIREGIELFKEFNPTYTRDTYIFSNHQKQNPDGIEYITRQNVDLIIKQTADKIGIDKTGMSTHTLRKTYAYHTLQTVGNDDRGVKVLQKILGHSNIESTNYYLGITQDEIESVCMRMNITKE